MLDRGPVQRNCVSHAIEVMKAGESQVFVSMKMKQRTRMMQVSRNMEEGDEAWTGDSGEENAHKSRERVVRLHSGLRQTPRKPKD